MRAADLESNGIHGRSGCHRGSSTPKRNISGWQFLIFSSFWFAISCLFGLLVFSLLLQFLICLSLTDCKSLSIFFFIFNHEGCWFERR
ncbi:hypothetical protein JHK82_012221 [Glycine max]|uniref:Uncharacterized protein n=1 Tax=Glycine max TaxID=3847 RepID=K7KNV2_SOYBN|nr:hypothetical protein JHK86_012224 [Glycine max]KAG5154252.1 hypothetical protein JHK82_012221 [Glycine max]KAH1133381.1 hypothetical protein GYH30_011984 [Glycine max]KRH57857.1 hypothetical protein GLYMA_05G088700v4 [Glycine max]